MLWIAEKLYVWAQSDLCEMNKLFIQRRGQKYLSPWQKTILFIQENFHASKSFWKIYPLQGSSHVLRMWHEFVPLCLYVVFESALILDNTSKHC